MLLASGIVPGHSILHLLDKDGESQPNDIAQQLLNQVQRPMIGKVKKLLKIPSIIYQQQRKLDDLMKIQELRYRDIVDMLDKLGNILRHNTTIKLKTNYPVAVDNLDHLLPLGTAQDNTRNLRFLFKCREIYGGRTNLLDLGCSGGGLVFEFALNGLVAIGLEGSDFSKNALRANWRTLPNNLFTCDVTKPFELTESGGSGSRLFTVISAWEVLEHLPEESHSAIFSNIRRHLMEDGIFVGSISTDPNDPRHLTVRSEDWWENRFRKYGLSISIGYNDVFEFKDFCHGISSGRFDTHNYKETPGEGFHFVSRHESGRLE